eukprot:2921373-Karenia_brevis.AAC.1
MIIIITWQEARTDTLPKAGWRAIRHRLCSKCVDTRLNRWRYELQTGDGTIQRLVPSDSVQSG